jgi:mono/diheme cytochrome c family protein
MTMSNWFGRKLTVLVLAMFALSVATAAGHGDKGHAEDPLVLHMQAMYALKEQIPEEYRIMERSPLLPSEQSLARGREAFAQHCVACHGPGGQGDGSAAKGLPPPPAIFLDMQHSAIYGAGEKFWIIGNGSGATDMPAFSHLDPRTRWDLVNYIYHLQGAAAKPQQHHHHH